jgi:hypothetical protein
MRLKFEIIEDYSKKRVAIRETTRLFYPAGLNFKKYITCFYADFFKKRLFRSGTNYLTHL